MKARSNRNAIAALAAIMNVTCAWASDPATATHPTTQVGRPDTANAVSLDPDAPNSYLLFAPELGKTLARMPPLDPATGLHVEEVKPGLFYVTDGVYQSGFVRTGQGIIVFDAPPSFAHKLPGVIAEHAGDEAVKYLLYSHSHADHVGGSTAFRRRGAPCRCAVIGR